MLSTTVTVLTNRHAVTLLFDASMDECWLAMLRTSAHPCILKCYVATGMSGLKHTVKPCGFEYFGGQTAMHAKLNWICGAVKERKIYATEPSNHVSATKVTK